jgi:hypothetical protein
LTTSAKTRIAAAICALFMVWPAVHRALTAIYDTNAWRLGGFAMYATPPGSTHVSIAEIHGSRKTFRSHGALPDALVKQRRLYSLRRSALGSLLPPDALAEAYFRARPDVNEIEVMITRRILSASNARIENRETLYVFDRRTGE